MDTESTPLLPQSSTQVALPSLKKRIVQVICAILWCLVAAGPVFGFAALKPVLISQGVYEDACYVNGSLNTFTNNDSVFISTPLKEPLCNEQDLKLNFIFTMAAVITNATALLVGRILDTYGPRITGIIGSFILLFAALIFINAKSITFFDTYLIGYILLAFGGPFTFISCFQLANSFPGNSGLVLALLTGAFDSSSALFLLYRIIYTNDLFIHDFTIEKFFKIYLVVPVFIFLCQYFIMPHESYKTIETLAKIGESGLDETGEPIDALDPRYQSDAVENLTRIRSRSSTNSGLNNDTTLQPVQSHGRRTSFKSTKSVFEEIADQQLIAKSGGIYGVLHDYGILDQVKSPWFYLMMLFTTIQMLRINYFVATIKSQELFLFNGNLEIATRLNKFFDLALPLGGIISIPFIGVLLDNFQTLTVLTILLITSLAIGVFGIIPFLPTTYLGIILLVIYRPFYYTAVSDYCAKVFGYKTFGTVYGFIISFSGLWNLSQTGLDYLTHSTFNMNPIPVNSFLVFLTLLFGASIIWYIKKQESEIQRDILVNEAMNSEEVYVPN